MADKPEQDKTEKASVKKLSEGRDKGQVAKSIEVNSFALLTFGLFVLYLTRNTLGNQFGRLGRIIFGSLDKLQVNVGNITELTTTGIYYFLLILAPIFLTMFIVALLVSIVQVGFKITPKALQPKLDKLNVLSGVKNIFFSSRSIVESSKSALKLLIIGGFVYFIISDFVKEASNLVNLSVSEIVQYMLHSALSLVWKVLLLFSVIAGLDFVYQKHKFNKDMMMTKQEVKEENKQSDGDPLVKQRIRKLQMESSKKRMIQNLPLADVVITNPTHFAVALKYDLENDSAPEIIAKGMDLLALKIKAIAKEHDIPIQENKLLARALYKSCEVGDTIPQDLYLMVAEVLAYIYKIKEERKRKRII